jgi:hypothetical protein
MSTDKMLWRNRKLKKELARRSQSENPGLDLVHPHAAGIDVGNSAHHVAVRPDRDPQPVRRFECFTDPHRLANWLQSCGVKTVALQSTGVYWIPLYDILEERGKPRRTSLRRWDSAQTTASAETRCLLEGLAMGSTARPQHCGSTLLPSRTYLGAQYRRLRAKLGAPKAITAMAHQLARLLYRMLKYGQQYIDKGAEYYEQRNRQQQIEFVRKKAAQLGLQITAAHV